MKTLNIFTRVGKSPVFIVTRAVVCLIGIGAIVYWTGYAIVTLLLWPDCTASEAWFHGIAAWIVIAIVFLVYAGCRYDYPDGRAR